VPEEEIQEQIEESPIEPGAVSLDDLKDQVLNFSQKIINLTQNYNDRVEDLELAQEMAQAIKPFVDRIIAINQLLNPMDRILAKREQIEKLQIDIAEDLAKVEDLAEDAGSEVEGVAINELQGEISSFKRKDRKLVVNKVDAGDTSPSVKPSSKKKSPNLLDLPLESRFQRIFGNRFISISRIESLLGINFSASYRPIVTEGLNQVWNLLLGREELRPHLEGNRIKTLQTTFSDYALLLRSPLICNSEGEEVHCTLATLRNRFNTFFVRGSEQGLWYTNLPFYQQPIAKGHWVLLDRQYLNCTFKKPSIRLLMYSRANGLLAKMVRQKSVTEDIYDRILLELALRERFVDNCHSITSTTYKLKNSKDGHKQVYTYYKDDAIRISGKNGTPHWHPSKPRWPGVLPSIVIPLGSKQ